MTAEPEYLPADVLAEEEPKYLRRQKPVEIRKRKSSRKTWPLYRRVLSGAAAALAGGLLLYHGGHYLLFSPEVLLKDPGQIEIEGARFVSPGAVVKIFSADLGRSIVRVPLERRREALESLAWVEQARVQRVLPNRIRVTITERSPVAFLRTGTDLSLLDASGIILDRPLEGDFRFPVVGGIGESTPRDVRAQRMKLFAAFMKEVELARPGADDHVSEVDLSNAADLCATIAGLGAAPGNTSPILVHFGDSDFSNRYHLLAENIDQWRASAGRVDSVDLRFARQVVVNPDTLALAAAAPHADMQRARAPIPARRVARKRP